MDHGLAWALEHDRATALRLAIALAPWWQLRGRFTAGYALLAAASLHAAGEEDAWCAAQLWLGWLAIGTNDLADALGHFTAVRDAIAAWGPSAALAAGLAGRSAALLNVDRIPKAAEDARRALDLAREIGYPPSEALALVDLSLAASYTEDRDNALAWARQAKRIDLARIPGWLARLAGDNLTSALVDAGEVAAAQRSCAEGLASAQQAGALYDQAFCLELLADLDRRAGHMPEAGAHLRMHSSSPRESATGSA